MLKRAFSYHELAPRFGGCCISYLGSNWQGLDGPSIAGVLGGLLWHTRRRGAHLLPLWIFWSTEWIHDTLMAHQQPTFLPQFPYQSRTR